MCFKPFASAHTLSIFAPYQFVSDCNTSSRNKHYTTTTTPKQRKLKWARETEWNICLANHMNKQFDTPYTHKHSFHMHINRFRLACCYICGVFVLFSFQSYFFSSSFFSAWNKGHLVAMDVYYSMFMLEIDSMHTHTQRIQIRLYFVLGSWLAAEPWWIARALLKPDVKHNY